MKTSNGRKCPTELTAQLQAVCAEGSAGWRRSSRRILTVEEAYLLCKLARKFDPQAVLALGPVPVVGEDETFPGKFTIHAEKCPNRKGVEEVSAHFCGGQIKTFDELLEDLPAGRNQSGLGQRRLSRRQWIDDDGGRAIRRARFADRARYVRFAAVARGHVSVARRGVCRARRLVCEFRRSAAIVRPGPFVRRPACGSKGSCIGRMLGMRGLYNARTVLDEVAAEIIAFSAAADEDSAGGHRFESQPTRRSDRREHNVQKPLRSCMQSFIDCIMTAPPSLSPLIKIAAPGRRADDGGGVSGAAWSAGWRPGCKIAAGRTASAFR